MRLVDEAFLLKDPLVLQSDTGDLGQLPKGTEMYSFRYLGEIATFVVFVNTKQLSSLEPVTIEKPQTMSPIDAYSR